MSPVHQLLAVLAVLLLAEGVLWLRRGAFAFRALGPFPFRAAQPASGLGTARGGPVLGRVVPAGEVFTCEEWPVSISPEGALGATGLGIHPDGRPPGAWPFVPFGGGVRFAAEGAAVLAGREVLARTQSETVAREIADLLAEAAALPETKRAERIGAAHDARFSREACRARLEAGRRGARRTRVPSLGLLVAAFAGLPALHASVGLLRTWPFLLAAVVAFVAWAALAVRRGWMELDPGNFAARRRSVALVALLPTTAMRAREQLDRDLLASFHPLTVACVTCASDEVERLAGAFLRDAIEPERPACPIDVPAARRVEAWHRARIAERLSRLAREAGLDPAALVKGAGREGAAAWCPRCLALYAAAGGTCRDCLGVPLVTG